ncbi:MAG: putative carbamoyl transferase, NodU family [Chthoniobacteraceae bacterium]|nr:putative carbamoyl transferase, NodU family [Chthoniobacteraceae bacterium]
MVNILGINAYHGDSSAALIQDGQLVAACEEERFNRIKHWAGFPAESIRQCLKLGGISAGDVDHVALSFDPRANLGRKLLFTLKQPGMLRRALGRLQRQAKVAGLPAQFAEAAGCAPEKIRAQFHHVEHHLAHVASSFFVSGSEKSAVLSVDGMGDFTSTLLAGGEGLEITEFNRVYYPHSLGLLYNAITLYLGFPAYGDEYKVMGLAPYGEPEYLEFFRRLIFPRGDTFALNLDYFTHHRQGIAMSWNGGVPQVNPFHSARLEKELGPARVSRAELTKKHENIAASLQAVTEEIVFHLLNRLHRKYPVDQVCLAGGVAMNSVANGKVSRNTPFRHVFVPVGAADNGTALGAAFHVWHRGLKKPRSFVLDHAYWGDEASESECLAAIEGEPVRSERMEQTPLIEKTIDALLEGKVVGWFQGRMEFGARALGNRSLIADPRRRDMQEIINLKIKFREKFRPFAPSILEEYAGDWFEAAEPSPSMEKVLTVRSEKRDEIPAVVHVDGTGRLQTVSTKTNPLYHALIEAFRKRTGVPILLNTSLNENEPIVQTPKQALSCMLRTRMDVLVLGNFWVERAEGN